VCTHPCHGHHGLLVVAATSPSTTAEARELDGHPLLSVTGRDRLTSSPSVINSTMCRGSVSPTGMTPTICPHVEHRDPVRDTEDVVHVVRNQDDSDAFARQATSEGQYDLGL
jgi:hypothetical protein